MTNLVGVLMVASGIKNWLRVDGLVIWMAVHEAALYWFLHLVHV